MRRRGLKFLRVAVAAVVFAGLGAAFVDFRGWVPRAAGQWLASVQFVPSVIAFATGSGLALAWLVILAVTLAAGRVYCSAVCPLGILQDLVSRATGWRRRRKPRWPYRPAATTVRAVFFGGALGGIIAGWAGLTLTLVDPYSLFGRMAAELFRPVVALVNNAAVSAAGAWGADHLYRVAPHWAGAGALAVPAALLLLLVGLAAWRGRLYCNTVCPVGTLLGLVADRGAWRLTLDAGACQRCGDCLRVCKAQCIDLRAGTIDASRCVACYNCLGACPEHGIRHRWSWRRVAPAVPVEIRPAAGPSRRTFLRGAATALVAAAGAGTLRATGAAAAPAPNSSRGICPPGAESVDRFLDRCTACHLCFTACPTQVLQPAWLEYGVGGWLRPRLDFTSAFCNFDCARCAEVCPDGAISRLPPGAKQLTRIGVAQLDVERCIVKTKGTDCAACSEHCPTKAVDTVPYAGHLRLPQVTPELCIGCGACTYACPAQPDKAITVAGLRVHERASRKVEEKAKDPRRAGDFPF